MYIYIHKDYSIYIYIAGLSCFFFPLTNWDTAPNTPYLLFGPRSCVRQWIADTRFAELYLTVGWSQVGGMIVESWLNVGCMMFFLRNGEVDPALYGFIFSILKLSEYNTLRISVDFIHGQFDGMMTARFFREKHHTYCGWLKAYKWWDKPSINWCRISSIHSIIPFILGQSTGWVETNPN